MCGLCEHANRKKFEAELAAGEKYKTVALTYGLDASKLRYHWIHHTDMKLQDRRFNVKRKRIEDETARLRRRIAKMEQRTIQGLAADLTNTLTDAEAGNATPMQHQK